MGFFKKLFDKKECSLCGGEIGLLGNRKLEDGNMCKDCAAKLSPWFSDRRNSTVQQISDQLQYREQNQAELRNFRATKSIGQYYKVFVEEVQNVPTRFVVSRDNNYVDGNADIISFKDVTSCNVEIKEHREEIKRRNDQNEMVSYDPPRYRYQYDFYVELTIGSNPYIDEMKFKINRDSVDIETESFGRRSSSGIGQFLIDSRKMDPSFNPEYREYKKMCDELEQTFSNGQKGVANVKFEEALLGALNQLAGQNAAGMPSAAAPAQEAPRPKFCPNCGAPASGGKFCEHCGSKL